MVSMEAEVRVEHLAEAKKSSEQTADIIGEPLTPAEVKGQFAWLKPWTCRRDEPARDGTERRPSKLVLRMA